MPVKSALEKLKASHARKAAADKEAKEATILSLEEIGKELDDAISKNDTSAYPRIREHVTKTAADMKAS